LVVNEKRFKIGRLSVVQKDRLSFIFLTETVSFPTHNHGSIDISHFVQETFLPPRPLIPHVLADACSARDMPAGPHPGPIFRNR